MFKPQQTLLFLLGVGAICGGLMFLFPVNGIKITDEFTLNFAHWTDFETKDTTTVLDVEKMLTVYEEPFDSASFKDSIKLYDYNVQQKKLRIHYASGQTEKMPLFFAALADDSKQKKIRIIHYGDSQIEGDRISSYLRDKLQKEFGGRGPGYAPPLNQVPNMSLKQSNSDHWIRYTIFGRKDTTVKHKEFGAFGIFGRFTPYRTDTLPRDTVLAWVEYEKSPLGYSGTRVYRNVTILFGNAETPFRLKIFRDDELYFDQWLSGNTNHEKINFPFSNTPKKLRFEFTGTESPDIYAFIFEDSRGVVVDNVAMRGSSGTIFNRISQSQMRAQYKQLKPKLIILQYGGNTVPYITSTKKAENYGNWMSSQIKTVKKLNPQANIVLIGPSDMATKVKTDYVTYPYLIEVRNELKKAALANGIGFWDIFEVMGGENSMQYWVDADPALAAKDYIHFTPTGARHVATLFYDALMKDYFEFLDHRAKLLKEQQRIQDSLLLLTDTIVNDSLPETL